MNEADIVSLIQELSLLEKRALEAAVSFGVRAKEILKMVDPDSIYLQDAHRGRTSWEWGGFAAESLKDLLYSKAKGDA